MTWDESKAWKQPPPPRPRQRNVRVLRLLDGPVHRDPMFWWLLAIFVLMIAVFTTSPMPPSAMPPVVEIPLAIVVMTFLFGVVPAILRLQVRRLLWRWSTRRTGRSGVGVGSPPAAFREPGASAHGAPPVTPVDRQSTQRRTTDVPTARLTAPKSGPQPAAPTNPGPPSAPAERTVTDPDTGQHPSERSPLKPARSPTPPPTPPAKAARPAAVGPGDLATHAGLLRAREFQYPVARAVRTLQAARSAREGYDALRDVTDALIVTSSVAALGWVRSADPASPIPARLAEQFSRGISLGAWLGATREVLAAARTIDGAPEPLKEAGRSRKGGVRSLTENLDPLISERNDWAHGNTPRSEADAAHRLATLLPFLVAALERSEFLHAMPWIVTDSIAYDGRSGSFEVSARRAMHDHPEFDGVTLTLVTPVSNRRVYQIVEDIPVDLTPFVVVRDCVDCRRAELFYADKWKESGVVLKSFVGTGHSMKADDLGDEMSRLRPRAD